MAISASVEDDGFRPGFVAPTGVDRWVRFLKTFKLRNDPAGEIPERHRRNIGYRLQLMEFECALLLLNIESRQLFGDRSTLHSTVHSMKCHQFTVLTYSVIEGIGAHLFRRLQAAPDGGRSRRVASRDWQSALIGAAWPNSDAQTIGRIEDRIKLLTVARNKLHLDLIDVEGDLHIDEFYDGQKFKQAGSFFYDFATAFGVRWPDGTCLADQNAWAGF